MKLRKDLTINGKTYKAGEQVTAWPVYIFFIIHMGAFGASGFVIAYSSRNPDVAFLYMHGGLAIFVYMFFYVAMFGIDEIKWMLINAGLGILGIYSQIDWILSFFDKQLDDFRWYVHVIPFLYFIMYTFLLRQMVIDITGSRENERRRQFVEYGYLVALVLFYLSGLAWHDDTAARERAAGKTYRAGTTSSGSPSAKTVVDEATRELRKADRLWDKRNYAGSYEHYKKAYAAASRLDPGDSTYNRKLAFSSSGIMVTACMLGKWEEADEAMAELKERYEQLDAADKKKMDYWIRTGEPRLKKRKC